MTTIAKRDARIGLFSKRGAALVALFFLVGTLPSTIRIWMEQSRGPTAKEVLARDQAQSLVKLYGSDVALALQSCPQSLVALALLTLLFTPLFVLIAGHEVLSRDIESGSLRFTASRASRPAIVVGKAMGLWLQMVLMMLAVHGLLWIGICVSKSATVSEVWLDWGPFLLGICAASAFGYVGLTVLVSSVQPRGRVIVVGIIVCMIFWFLRTVHAFGPRFTKFLLGANDAGLLSHRATTTLSAVVALVAWGIVFTALASLIMKRRDI